MRVMRFGPFFAFSLMFSVTAIQAQQSPTPIPAPRDAQAVSLLQRSLSALGGSTTVNDVTLSANANWIAGSDNQSGSATLKATAIGQGRVDLSLSGGQRSEVIDMTQGPPTGSWCGPDGVWHFIVAHNLFSDPTWFFPTFLIKRALSGVNYAISATDAETQDGVAVEHVTIYQQSGLTPELAALNQGLSQIDLYLNPSTLLPVSISFNMHPDTNALVNIPVEIKFSNYQVVQGAAVPYNIQKYIQNSLALDVTVTSVQVNSGPSAADFQAQ
ncbi:MAG: hypothetical protein WBL99_09325 [Candidatus Acidiferrales bacterium]